MKRPYLIPLALVLLQGCAAMQIRPVERDYSAEVRVDSIRVLDSVYIDRIRTVEAKADTVFVTDVKTEYKYRYRDRVQTDTLIVEREKVVMQEVERELTRWQNFRLRAFWWLLGAVALWLTWKIAKLRLSL